MMFPKPKLEFVDDNFDRNPLHHLCESACGRAIRLSYTCYDDFYGLSMTSYYCGRSGDWGWLSRCMFKVLISWTSAGCVAGLNEL